jgi:hypothetical protein
MRPYRTLYQARKMVNPVQTSVKRSLSPDVTVLDVEQKSSPQAKKPRLSTASAEKDKTNGGAASARAAAIAAALATGSPSAKDTASKITPSKATTSKKPVAASSAVKKAIFMPGCKYSFLPLPYL